MEVDVLLSLLIVVLVLGLVWWVISLLPLKEPFRTAATVIFALIAIFVLLSFLPTPNRLWGGSGQGVPKTAGAVLL